MSEKLAMKIEKIVRRASGISHGPVVLHEPFFNGNERQYVVDCIDTNWVSSVGKYVNLFEQLLCRTTGSKYAVATVNGTAALHISLLLAGVKADDEVLIPALSFVAAANAISYCNAIPNFVDISEESLGVCPKKLRAYLEKMSEIKDGICHNRESGRPVRALLLLHTFGHPAHLDELKKVCEDFSLKMIEDAAEAIGSTYKNRHVGNHGDLSILSFNGNKIITTGGGGAILTNNKALADQARHLTTTGKLAHQWEYLHDCIAYNYRMPNINAALGCAQMEVFSEILMKKRLLASRYRTEFSGVEDVTFFGEMPDVKSNYWLNAIILKEPSRKTRNAILDRLNGNGIMARPAWNLMPDLPMYKNCPSDDLSLTKKIEASLLNIPSSPSF